MTDHPVSKDVQRAVEEELKQQWGNSYVLPGVCVNRPGASVQKGRERLLALVHLVREPLEKELEHAQWVGTACLMTAEGHDSPWKPVGDAWGYPAFRAVAALRAELVQAREEIEHQRLDCPKCGPWMETARVAEEERDALRERVVKLEEELNVIAQFAVGNGDVCDIIARRIRALLAPPPPQDPPAEALRRKRQRIHYDYCAVPDARFADDARCTCGLRDQIDSLGSAPHTEEEK